MREFIRHALEREARSLAFLDEIRSPDGRPGATTVPPPSDEAPIGGRA
jgi:hypothetical protein